MSNSVKNNESGEGTDTSDPVQIREQLEDIRSSIIPPESEHNTYFEQSVDPCFILHVLSGAFIAINDAFESLYGYDRRKFRNGTVRAEDLIVSEDQNLLKLARRAPKKIPNDEYELRVKDQSGNTFHVRTSISHERIQDQNVLYGSMRQISNLKEKEKKLRSQLNEAVQANNRILALTEKIRQVPVLTSDLLNKKFEKEIFRKAKQKLCERTGLNYKDVTFYLFDDTKSHLEPPFADEDEPESISMKSDHPAIEVASGEKNLVQPDENAFILPLRGGDTNFGVMEIRLHPKEQRLMQGNKSVWSGYQETLVTLSDLLGLILQNHRLYDKVRRESIHDELTDIYNRRHFNRTLKQEVYRSKRYEIPLSLIIVDVDDFKNINDRYGHQEGDRVLKQIAQTLQSNSRESDIVCRYGGDEFALILPETAGKDAEKKAKTLLDTFEETSFTVELDSKTVRNIQIEISVGISYLPLTSFESSETSSETYDHQELLKTADKCMYRAKMSEDHQIVRYDPSDKRKSG